MAPPASTCLVLVGTASVAHLAAALGIIPRRVAAGRGCNAHAVAAGNYDVVVNGVATLVVSETTAGRLQHLNPIVVKDAASCLDLIVVVGQGLASAQVSGRKVTPVAASQNAGARAPPLGRVP